jgi:hypothetical protein
VTDDIELVELEGVGQIDRMLAECGQLPVLGRWPVDLGRTKPAYIRPDHSQSTAADMRHDRVGPARILDLANFIRSMLFDARCYP